MSGPIPSENLQRQNRELAILNAIATALNESVDLSASLDAALSHVADLFDLDTGWVWLLREDDGTAYLAAARNLPEGLAGRPEAMEGRCYCLDTFRAGDLSGAANVNVVTCSRLRQLTEGTAGLRYHASIPLYVRGEKLGVMNVASGEWRRLSPEDLRLLHIIGEILGTAIERIRLFQRSVEAGATEERNRLAREIHDTLAQGLSATALHLDTAEALLATDGDRDQIEAAVHRALESTRRNLEEARRSVLDLRAAPLEGRTLAAALDDLVHELQRAGEPGIELRIVGGARPLPARLEMALYRVAQEAIANALRHAAARHIAVQFVSEPTRLTLCVEDDGRGFDGSGVPGRSFGLVGMRERMRLIGGSLRVETEPGKGTRVEATVDLSMT